MKRIHRSRLLAFTLLGFLLFMQSSSSSPITGAMGNTAQTNGGHTIYDLPDSNGHLSRSSAGSSVSSRSVTYGGNYQAISLTSPISLFNPSDPPGYPPLDPRSQADLISPGFDQFVDLVADGQAGVIRGVYVEGILALQVVQQPENDLNYVAEEWGLATQFRGATDNGVTGLLAHNYLSGELFYELFPGLELDIVYGDGSFRRYQIMGTYSFQKISSDSLPGNYISLSDNQRMTTQQVFNWFYKGLHHVTLQTCLEKYGISNWGLTFVVAVPIWR